MFNCHLTISGSAPGGSHSSLSPTPPWLWQQVVLKPSPSLVYNNLCTVATGLAYIHTRSVTLSYTDDLVQARVGEK